MLQTDGATVEHIDTGESSRKLGVLRVSHLRIRSIGPAVCSAAVSLLALAVFTTTAASAAITSNAVGQFSLKANPHGQWSYQAGGEPLSVSVPRDFCGSRKLKAWTNGGTPPGGGAGVAGNKSAPATACSSNSSVIVPSESLSLDPEGLPNVAVVWTAKRSGTYRVSGEFVGDDTSEIGHPVGIFQNGRLIYANSISSYGQSDSFNFTVSAAKGDTVSFAVFTSGSGGHLSTGLQATLMAS
jgi:hypothetical protein